ncbi:uncharacterized protein Tco025E_04265 [Trypanosoma conorhini]|uniref:Uncharacterized protein n=1 Tax=Trypanosoma conorhini TaxID=83891 RepID=A0A422PMJ1_9TRYP|nr:uncharacterized protein Tco025E_04265 [Trypanosoma conorhini]RNF18936.1 hypothetical protein Tco025E_04265 [Trypanosoma conorhini]
MSAAAMESTSQLRTGDIVLMDRRCLSMRHPVGIAICLLNKTECRFDHVAMIMKLTEEELREEGQTSIVSTAGSISPSGTYVLETNLNGITLRSLEHRVARSSANQISARLLHMEGDRSEAEKIMLEHLKTIPKHPYKSSLLEFLPSFFSTPDKMDRVKAAHKIHLLAREIASIDNLMPEQNPAEDAAILRRLRQIYVDAAVFLGDVYFPHLKRLGNKEFPSIDWSEGHFAVDGNNTDHGLFCSELIVRLWQGVGMVPGFPPASSFRPLDFLDDVRFNFLGPTRFVRNMLSLTKGDSAPVLMWHDAEEEAKTVTGRLNFYRRVTGDVRLEGGLRSMHHWLIQSNTYQAVSNDLDINLFSLGVLFALSGWLLAPLRLRWIECQLGVMLRRGGMWSLSAGFLVRDLFCALTQTLTACLTLRCLSPPRPNSASPAALLGPPLFESALFDTRHPYYHVCAVLLTANAVAHVATTPLLNAVVAHHFGPVTPRPWPLRTLMRGAVSLWPMAILLPYQAAWLTWYETAGSAFIPTPSSLLRRRCDLLDTDEWRHFRYEAMAGAFAATAFFDVALYPLQTRCWRSFLSELHRPAPSPSYGRRLYAGYSFRFAGNIISMVTTTLSLSFLGLL